MRTGDRPSRRFRCGFRILEAIETGHEIGTPVGEDVAEGCAAVTMLNLRTQAQLGYQELFGSRS